MKYLLSKEDRQEVIELCNAWIDGNLSVEYIKSAIGYLAWAVSAILPKSEDGYPYLSSDIDILIDDILEMDSISDEEKDKAILELIDEEDYIELKSLAQRVIEQLEKDEEEYKKYAKEHGYCPILTDKA